ncbi:excalibur calcium-binding protein [Streptomyces sp. NPDC002701]|uniref:excalibur calcium-binding protein n=1 Tax=Streptomyces sp. NPDC002701 TaxID=3364661 RepID=UPI00369F4ED4
MPRRTAVAAGIAAVVSLVPLAGTAHAQDVDCRDFAYQEDAQSVYNQDPTDPNRLDEDQGVDDGIACEVLPRRTGTLTSPAASTLPSPVASPPSSAPAGTPLSTPVSTSASARPTLGARAGVGGPSDSRPSHRDVVIGIGLGVTALLTAAGYLVARRRS